MMGVPGFGVPGLGVLGGGAGCPVWSGGGTGLGKLKWSLCGFTS